MLPQDAILVSDTGYSAIWTGTMIELTHPKQNTTHELDCLAGGGSESSCSQRPARGDKKLEWRKQNVSLAAN